MRLRTGTPYQIINYDVAQGTPNNPPRVVLHEILEIEGQLLCYGTKLAHQQEIYRIGFEDIPESPGAFVVLPTDNGPNTHQLSKILHGSRLGIHELLGDDIMFIVNWAERLGAVWWTPMGQDTKKDELIKRGKTVIRLYHEWKAKGVPPGWFLTARNIQPDSIAPPAG